MRGNEKYVDKLEELKELSGTECRLVHTPARIEHSASK